MRNSFKKTQNENKSIANTFDVTRIHIAEVMDTRNVTANGAIKIWLLNSPFPKTEQDKWLTAYYSTPFAGTTPDDTLNNEFEHTKKSYGMWFPVPDVGNHVLVCFANGRNGNTDLYYFACIHEHFMNHMIPGISKDLNSDDNSPKTEYNKAQLTQNVRTIYKPLNDGLIKQGLIDDPLRGTGKSSARRETPSRVYGFLTPRGSQIILDDGENIKPIENWDTNPDTSNLKDSLQNPVNQINKRKGECIRIRTRSGSQILISEDEGNIYINNKDGSTWFELHNDGYFDMYSQNDMSFRSNQNINIRADKKINIEAGEELNINVVNGNYNQEINGNCNYIINKDKNELIKENNLLNINKNNQVKINGIDELKVIGHSKHYFNTYDFKTNGNITYNYGGDCYKNYGKDLYQAYLNGGIRPFWVKYAYTATITCVPDCYPPTEPKTIPRCGTKDLEEYYNTLLPPTNFNDPTKIIKSNKMDKINIVDYKWNDINILTSVSRLPQHEPWIEHNITTKGYRNNVDIGDEDKIKPNSVKSTQIKPMTVIGRPRLNMPLGIYNGVDYKNNIPLYEYKPLPNGILNNVNDYTTSNFGIDFIQRKEGFEPRKYYCVAGKPTIGYGHVILKNERFDIINEDEATILLRQDLLQFEKTLKQSITVDITQNQFDSMVSLCFNIGSGAFRNSTLLKLLNQGIFEMIPNQFIRWRYATVNGVKQVVNGLYTRRIEEANIFSTYYE